MSRPLSDRGLWPGAETLRWEEDEMAQAVVDAFPEGMTLAQVGLCLGVNRERVRQIQEHAIAKLLDAADEADLADLREALADSDAGDEQSEALATLEDLPGSLREQIEHLASHFLLPRGRSHRRFA